jgi:hypothetical protein
MICKANSSKSNRKNKIKTMPQLSHHTLEILLASQPLGTPPVDLDRLLIKPG